MDNIKVLWVDDEIERLKPHLLFLEQKGYRVDTVNNGLDALDRVAEEEYQLVFLDENMPGMDGLETLQRIKEMRASLPVVMITKSEEESIMEEAIGSKISDYLIKPVNPKQILLSLKKNLDTARLINAKTTSNYQQEFRQIAMELAQVGDWEGWQELYKKLVYWELELDRIDEEGLREILLAQKKEANSQFFRFIEKTYPRWFGEEEAPVMSHTAFKAWVKPLLEKDRQVFLVLIDNLRYDQWRVMRPLLEEHFRVESEQSYCSILPTATQYARNAFFSGLLPAEMQKRFGDKWVSEDEEEGKNNYEADFLQDQLQRLGLGQLSMHYEKVTQHHYGKKLAEQLSNLYPYTLNTIVYNFVDMLSHAKTEMKVIRELADNDKAYRSLTLSWFSNSSLFDLLRQLAGRDLDVIITTDHGTINVEEPTKIVGEKSLNTNLRYKNGRGMTYVEKDVMEVKEPKALHLPQQYLNSRFLFAREDRFFAYPNNYNHYVKHYRNTYQHGGISLEEMIVPFVHLRSKA